MDRIKTGDMSVTQRRLEADAKLQMEKDNLAWLKEQCSESQRLTTGMVEILDSFEVRLAKLEETILPVYQETGNLQRRQENIEVTLSELDHVLSYYNVSKEVESVVREGPANSLHTFLQAMHQLKGALDYFSTNNPGSIELENVLSLYSTGGAALAREFSELLKKHSRPATPVQILNSVAANDSVSGDEVSHASSDDFSSILHFPEDVLGSIVSIAEWLGNNDKDEYMNVYANIRSHMMKRSLEGVREHSKSMSTGSGGRGLGPGQREHKFVSPAAVSGVQSSQVDPSSTPTNRKTSHQVRKMQEKVNRRMASMSSKLEAATGVALPVKTRTLLPGMDEAWLQGVVADTEVELFLTTLSCLQRLMASEQQLMVGIIPTRWQRRIFEMISRESLDMVVKEGEAITGRLRRSVTASEHAGVLSLFQLLRHVTQLKPTFDRTLEGCEPSVRAKLGGLVSGLQAGGTMALETFIEGIRLEATPKEKMPKDGTVFQLTSNILLSLEQLVEYMDTIADILGQDAAYNQALLRLPKQIRPSDRPTALLGLYFKKVLVQLNLTLVNKSEAYSDPFLKAVFRLNNNMYILRGIARSGLLEVISLSAPDCEKNYQEMITEQKRLYSASWDRVLQYIWNADDVSHAVLMAPSKLADKHCRIIKDKFTGFNKEIEDIAATQKKYSIPDVELRESLKRDNKEYILPKYNSFYDKYANVQFSSKTEKYIKYTPAQVSGLIDSFFDMAA